ncbi:unnamed protein product [Linum trigynum]|uniref:Uncharacterized protein n=1 Tax=Linum trigynum TaxID=586398 RepID=A0AAV2G9D4_9ROSI
MDPYDFTKVWGYSSIPEDGYPEASGRNQDGGSQGFRFFYRPPFQDEEPYQWGYGKASPIQEDFHPQPEPINGLEFLGGVVFPGFRWSILKCGTFLLHSTIFDEPIGDHDGVVHPRYRSMLRCGILNHHPY